MHEVLKEWDIPVKKVIAILTDNGSNMINLRHFTLKCFHKCEMTGWTRTTLKRMNKWIQFSKILMKLILMTLSHKRLIMMFLFNVHQKSELHVSYSAANCAQVWWYKIIKGRPRECTYLGMKGKPIFCGCWKANLTLWSHANQWLSHLLELDVSHASVPSQREDSLVNNSRPTGIGQSSSEWLEDNGANYRTTVAICRVHIIGVRRRVHHSFICYPWWNWIHIWSQLRENLKYQSS